MVNQIDKDDSKINDEIISCAFVKKEIQRKKILIYFQYMGLMEFYWLPLIQERQLLLPSCNQV